MILVELIRDQKKTLLPFVREIHFVREIKIFVHALLILDGEKRRKGKYYYLA